MTTPPRADKYNPHSLEPKWQKTWVANELYQFDPSSSRPKFYQLTMFPYPSGNLHIGHWYAYCPPDARARYMRMKGYEVLFPMGFDAFGLPAENAAIKNKANPRDWTYSNIDYMTGQFKRMGTMIDWSRQFRTCDSEYYRWNQWFFVQFYRKGLAYKKESYVNWDPVDQTVLANEQVIDGRGDRSGALVERKLMNQWNLRVTEYAEDLLDFSETEVPEKVRLMQTNWIGKSVGANITFETPAGGITVFTTRPDTLMGATFLVLAPEHALVSSLTVPEKRDEVSAYLEAAKKTSEIERTAEGKEKTGVFLGSYAQHPVNGSSVPIFIADYVMVTYGTGSIMAVPAHDQRDMDFARKFGLEIIEVIRSVGAEPMDTATITEAYSGEGLIVNSSEWDGLPGGKASIAQVIEILSAKGICTAKTTYRLRDWLISRQRFWGTPIPIIYCPKCGEVPVPEDQLPVTLPEDAEFTPNGQSPLKTHPTWRHTTCPTCNGPAERDTDTMDTFVCSSWYMRRFLDPHNVELPFGKELSDALPLNLYTGGVEHAILHLLYSRFWHKVMRDLGLVSTNEPFQQLRNQGMILGEDNEKMSKSRGNVIDPDNLVAEYGVDTVRLYLMFLAPWEDGGPWNSSGITGPFKWLGRVWSLFFDGVSASEDPSSTASSEKDVRFAVHNALKKVTQDLERFSFNTAIAAMMELSNTLAKAKRSAGMVDTGAWKEALELFNLMLAPFAPHIAEEIWFEQGNTGSIQTQSWPNHDESALQRDEMEIVIQVNGKLRSKITISSSAEKDYILALAKSDENVSRFVNGLEVVKEIYVPKKLVNIVVKG